MRENTESEDNEITVAIDQSSTNRDRQPGRVYFASVPRFAPVSGLLMDW